MIDKINLGDVAVCVSNFRLTLSDNRNVDIAYFKPPIYDFYRHTVISGDVKDYIQSIQTDGVFDERIGCHHSPESIKNIKEVESVYLNFNFNLIVEYKFIGIFNIGFLRRVSTEFIIKDVTNDEKLGSFTVDSYNCSDNYTKAIGIIEDYIVEKHLEEF